MSDVTDARRPGRRVALIGAGIIGFPAIATGVFFGATLLFGPDEPEPERPVATLNATDRRDPEPDSAPKNETDEHPIELDGDLVHDHRGVYVVDESGHATMVLDHPVATVFDDRRGGLLYQLDRDGLEGPLDELSLVTPSTEEQAVIWHLPAGATEPVVFRSADGPFELRSLDEPGASLGLYDVGTNADGEPAVLYVEYRHVPECSASPGQFDCRRQPVTLPDGELDVRIVGDRGIVRNYRLERDFGVHALVDFDDFYRIDLAPDAPEVLTKLEVDGTIVPLAAPLLRPTSTPVPQP